MLYSTLWWKDALLRAFRTVFVVLLPFTNQAGGAFADAGGPWLPQLLTGALAFVASLLTSLKGLPETDGNPVPWTQALITRMVKSFAQGTLAAFGTAVLITDLDWRSILTIGLSAALGSLTLGVLAALPESNDSPGSNLPAPDTPVVDGPPRHAA